MGLTRCYKTEVFFTFIIIIDSNMQVTVLRLSLLEKKDGKMW